MSIPESAPQFGFEVEPGDPKTARCRVACARCEATAPYYVNLLQAGAVANEQAARAAGLDPFSDRGREIRASDGDVAAIVSGLAWSSAVASGFRVEPTSGKIACSGSCSDALRRLAHDGGDRHWVDASRDPNDARLRQPAPPRPQPPGRREVSRTCAGCLSRADVHQTQGADGEWGPSLDQLFQGWVTTGGRSFCGRSCAERSTPRNNGAAVGQIPPVVVPVTKPLMPSPSRQQSGLGGAFLASRPASAKAAR
jgi:hypothetical protein